MSQNVEKRAEGSALKIQKIQKSKIQNLDFLMRGGGESRFSGFFPNVNVNFKCFTWTKNKLVLKWFLGNFKCFKLMFFFSEGGFQNQKFSQFQIFPELGPGGGHLISNFSQIQKSPKLPRGGGGGQANWGLFPLFVTFFFF